MKSCLAIIPARGGSKRIHRKNIKNFLGKPIIQYSIEAALTAGCFTEVMVSTDDTEIAQVASSAGAKVPFMRSVDTSNDYALTTDVIKEVLEKYGQQGIVFDYCCCIYPTAPFVTDLILKKAFEILNTSKAKSVVPVVRFGFPILRSFKIEQGLIKMNWPEYINIRTQDLPPSFHDCGQFYFIKTSAFWEENKLFTDLTIPIEMPESEVQDIDTYEDWKIAELKYKLLIDNDRNS